MPQSTGTLTSRIGVILTRVVVPLWVLAGALFKLYERTPTNLPGSFVAFGRKAQGWLPASQAEIDVLDVLLRTLIGLELLAVAVMLLMPRFARTMAIFMLSCFCIILLGEMYRQATSCGCFGSIKIQPWQMLIIDGGLLVGVLLTGFLNRPRQGDVIARTQDSLLKPSLAMILLLAISLGASFAVPDRPPTIQTGADAGSANGASSAARVPATQPEQVVIAPPADPRINPNPLPVPNSWYIKPSADAWVGQRWRDIDLFQLMPRWPTDLDNGKHYVVFYSRTCEHCRDMFYDHLLIPLDAPVAAVQIPNGRDVMTAAEGAWEMPPTPAELLELPLGCNWIITPPLALTIENGKVTCAVEGEGFGKCMGLP